MLPLVPFAAGLLAGAVAIKLIRRDKFKVNLGKTGQRLRDATVSSLTSLESASARARSKLKPQADVQQPVALTEAKASAPRKRAASRRKPRSGARAEGKES